MATKAQLRQQIADLENSVRDLGISRGLWSDSYFGLVSQHAALQSRYKAHQDASRELVRTAGGLIGDHQRLLKAEKALGDAQARLEAEKAAHALTTDVAREIISDLVLDRIGK